MQEDLISLKQEVHAIKAAQAEIREAVIWLATAICYGKIGDAPSLVSNTVNDFPD